MEPLIEKIRSAVIEGSVSNVESTVKEALESGIEVDIILNQGLISAMDEVGSLFESGEFFVPEMLIC